MEPFFSLLRVQHAHCCRLIIDPYSSRSVHCGVVRPREPRFHRLWNSPLPRAPHPFRQRIRAHLQCILGHILLLSGICAGMHRRMLLLQPALRARRSSRAHSTRRTGRPRVRRSVRVAALIGKALGARRTRITTHGGHGHGAGDGTWRLQPVSECGARVHEVTCTAAPKADALDAAQLVLPGELFPAMELNLGVCATTDGFNAKLRMLHVACLVSTVHLPPSFKPPLRPLRLVYIGFIHVKLAAVHSFFSRARRASAALAELLRDRIKQLELFFARLCLLGCRKRPFRVQSTFFGTIALTSTKQRRAGANPRREKGVSGAKSKNSGTGRPTWAVRRPAGRAVVHGRRAARRRCFDAASASVTPA